MTKTISILGFASALWLGSASAHANEAATRGQVSTTSGAAKTVVVGPVAIHAYSAYAGGSLYTVKAVSGTDADCRGKAEGRRAELRADSVVSFTVAAGEVACLATSAPRGFELLWHVQKDAPAPAPIETLLARN